MSKHIPTALLSMAFSVVLTTTLMAAPADETTELVAEAELAAQEEQIQARLVAEYKQALSTADRSRAQAHESMQRAREQYEMASEQRQREKARHQALSDKQHAQLAAMREELNRAQRQLRKSSREISQINRDLARVRMEAEAPGFVFSTGDRPVLGVILGGATDVGIEVLGVSPDGPAERACVKPGDEIVAMGGRVLASVDESGDLRKGLNIALMDISADEPLIVSVERGSDTLDLTVVPEVREPLSWQSVVRFPSVPHAPALAGETVMIERIVVPEIDTEALSEQIENMQIEIEERRELMEAGDLEAAPEVHHYEFQFDDMSEMGDFALHDTNTWFGMSLASGLRLAEVNPGLGEYFKAKRGVLVLQAEQDNDLLLHSGDVILNVHGTDVNSPAAFIRALREFEPGNELLIDIKRKRKSKTLKPIIEDSHAQYSVPQDHQLHKITIRTDSR